MKISGELNVSVEYSLKVLGLGALSVLGIHQIQELPTSLDAWPVHTSGSGVTPLCIWVAAARLPRPQTDGGQLATI